MSECLLPEWHEDGCVSETTVFDRAKELIDELGLEDQIVMDGQFLYLALDGFQFRFSVSLIGVEELDY